MPYPVVIVSIGDTITNVVIRDKLTPEEIMVMPSISLTPRVYELATEIQTTFDSIPGIPYNGYSLATYNISLSDVGIFKLCSIVHEFETR